MDKVARWRWRYADEGLKGIEKERPRGGNHGGKCPKAQAALRAEIIRRTTQERPPDATHWSCRTMARAVGTTHSFVNRTASAKEQKQRRREHAPEASRAPFSRRATEREPASGGRSSRRHSSAVKPTALRDPRHRAMPPWRVIRTA